MHVKEARIQGERELRLHHIVVGRESSLFSARERAVLEWTEAVTKLPPHGVPDEIFDATRKELSEQELCEITFQIVAINGWNRLAIAPPADKVSALRLWSAGSHIPHKMRLLTHPWHPQLVPLFPWADAQIGPG